MFDYIELWQNELSMVPYAFLGLAILSFWFKRHIAIWGSLLLLGIIFGFISGRLLPLSIITIVLLGLGYYLSFYPKRSRNPRYQFLRRQIEILTLLFSITPFYHQMPGFQNLEVAHQIKLSADAIPYSLYFNFDSPLIGLFILAFGWNYVNSERMKKQAWIKVYSIVLLTVITMSILALLFRYVRFDPKWNNFILIWAIHNLVFTCVTEEAIFRGLILNGLMNYFEKVRFLSFRIWSINITTIYMNQISLFGLGLHALLALLISAFLFGLVHFQGGPAYMVLAGIAGIFYGLAYICTQRIEASIITHFLVNLVHILLFTYPALQK